MRATGTWYPDPLRRAAFRLWSGAWTKWLSDGARVWADPVPARRPLVPPDLTAIQFVAEVFLPEAHARGVLTPDQEPGLRQVLGDLANEARMPAGVGYQPVGTAGPASGGYPPTPPPSPEPVVYTQPSRHPGRSRPPARQSRTRALRDWWQASRSAFSTGFAVHGLAYLGVLLLFVGVFGLVAFAFADVTPGMRPVAELATGTAPFLAAWMLLRRAAAVVVGRALEVAGGLLLPIMLITSFLDGYPAPPDLTGDALVLVLTLGCGLCGLGYLLWYRRHPESALRFVIVPVLWLTVAMAAMGLADDVPTGREVATPRSYQVAAVAGAYALTVAIARWRRSSRLVEATLTAAVPGVVVVALLAVLTWAAEGWPMLAILTAGSLLGFTGELLRVRVPQAAIDIAGPVWFGVVLVALGFTSPLGPVGAAAAAGFLVLLEAGALRGRPAWALALPAIGLVAGIAVVWAEPWWAFGAFAILTLWAGLRRLRPYRDFGIAFDVATGVLPLGTVVAAGVATSVTAGLWVGIGLLIGATALARSRALRREPSDGYWRHWWLVALPLLVAVALAAWNDAPGWAPTAAAAVLALASAAGPLGPVARPWVVTALAALSWLWACQVGALPEVVRGSVLAVVALAIVAVAALRRGDAALRRGDAALGFAGHALALVALGVGGSGWGLVAAAATATAGFAITAATEDRGAVGLALVAEGASLAFVPWILAAVGLPVTAMLALHTGEVLPVTDEWVGLTLAGAAVGYAGGTRLQAPERLRATLGWTSFAAAVVSLLFAHEARPAIVSLAALVAAVLLLAPAHRAAVMRWAAWLALAPLVGLLARQTPWFAELAPDSATALTAAVVGSAMLLASVWRRRSAQPEPAFVLGCGEVVLAGVLASLVPAPLGAWLVLGIAAVVLGVGVLLRQGALAGLAVVVAWLGVLRLAGAGLAERPWASVAVMMSLLVVAEGLHRLVPRHGSRWDIPVLASSAPVALTALVTAQGGDQVSGTFALVGLLVVAVGVRLYRAPAVAETIGWAGVVLVLIGAGVAGPGWLALALLGVAAGNATLAMRSSGGARSDRRLVSALAAIGAWGAGLAWFAWPEQVAIDVSAIVGAVVVLLAAILARTFRFDRALVLVWGGAAMLVAGVAVLTALTTPTAQPTYWAVTAVGMVAFATGWAAGSLLLPALRDLAMLLALGAGILALQVAGVSPAGWVQALSAAAAALAVLTLLLGSLRPGDPWVRPTAELGGGTVLIAVLNGLSLLPDSAPLVPALAAAAVQTGAAGVALRTVWLQVLAPPLACTAWVLFLAQRGEGPPQWYTAAIGLALLSVVALWRRDRRVRGVDLVTGPMVALELTGLAFLVGGAFVQAITDSLAHALVAAGLGLGIALWGSLTRVRRRLAAGGLVVLAALVLLVAVPMVELVPAWDSPGAWLLLIGVGLLAVLVAALLERGRNAVRSAMDRMGKVTADWE